jgi:hypothetical protein
MNVGIWIQLGRDFVNFCKPFLNEGQEKKILLNKFLGMIILFENFHNPNE